MSKVKNLLKSGVLLFLRIDIFKNIFKVNTETGLLFDVLLHIATLVAVFLVYYKDIIKMVKEGIGIIVDVIYNISVYFKNKRNKNRNEYRKIIKMVIVNL